MNKPTVKGVNTIPRFSLPAQRRGPTAYEATAPDFLKKKK